MDAASEGDERVTSLWTKVTDVRSYPAILTESKRVSRSKITYGYRGDLFVGLVIVRVVSASTDREEAKANFETFIAAMEILDVPPGATSGLAGTGPVALVDGAATSPK